MAKLIFKPSGPAHVFNALIGSGYVHADSPGPVDMTAEQATLLLAMYPQNFSKPEGEKAAEKPESNKAMIASARNKGRGKGGEG